METSYQAIKILFSKPIAEIDKAFAVRFKDLPARKNNSMKEWWEFYEGNKFIQVDDITAIVVVEQNIKPARDWFVRGAFFKEQEIETVVIRLQ